PPAAWARWAERPWLRERTSTDGHQLRTADRLGAPRRAGGVQGALPDRRGGDLPAGRREDHRPLSAEALSAAADAPPRAVDRRLHHRPRHRPVRRAPPPDDRRGLGSGHLLYPVQAPPQR